MLFGIISKSNAYSIVHHPNAFMLMTSVMPFQTPCYRITPVSNQPFQVVCLFQIDPHLDVVPRTLTVLLADSFSLVVQDKRNRNKHNA